MPEIRTYEVRQVRVVQVKANHEIDAARIAQAAFENGQNSSGGVIDGPDGIWGNTTKAIKNVRLEVERTG